MRETTSSSITAVRLVYAAWSACAWLCACGSEPRASRDAGHDAASVHDAGPARASRLDLLFVIDNSSSMKEEQAALRAAFPRMLQKLGTGDHDGDGKRDHVPILDLHLGVVSSNMGADAKLRGCEDLGDDGLLRHVGNPARDSSLQCEPMYPSFLTYKTTAPSASGLSKLADDFACIGALGTAGCGFEQHLESALKALWPASQRELSFLDTDAFEVNGHGDRENAGFLRNTRGSAVTLAVVVIADEDDCSTSDRAIFRGEGTADAGNPYADQALSLRCFYNHDKAFPIERYLFGLQHVGSRRVRFAGIVGVPSDLVDPAARSKVSFLDAAARSKYYDKLLGDARMQEQLDPTSSAAGKPASELLPACRGPLGVAAPARRFVELAKRFGEDALIESVCSNDFGAALDRIAAHLCEAE